MVELSKIKKNQRVADLGSGDGRIGIEFARTGAYVDGFELDEKLIETSIRTIKDNDLSKNIKIHKKNFWDIDFSIYDIITVYPMPDIMQELENKILREAKSNIKIITNYYEFPNLKYKTTKNNIYLYAAK